MTGNIAVVKLKLLERSLNGCNFISLVTEGIALRRGESI